MATIVSGSVTIDVIAHRDGVQLNLTYRDASGRSSGVGVFLERDEPHGRDLATALSFAVAGINV